MKALAALLLIPFLAGCPGANTVPSAWLDADHARLNSIGTEYADYVDADTNLSEEEKATRRRSVELWKIDNDENRAATNAAGGQ